MSHTIVPAEGVRLPWEGVPDHVRRAVEAELGAAVVAAVTQTGGFSPGVAARLRLDDGRRVFVKAVSAETNDISARMHRKEARKVALLPPGTPAPRLLGSYDDGTWVVLVFEEVEGRQPHIPWERDELRRVLAALGELARIPAPDGVHAPREDGFGRWREIVAAYDAGEDDLHGLDPWVRDRIHELAEREDRWAVAAAGDTLAHGDVRADNILLTADGAVFVDWPHTLRAAPWFDLLISLPCIAMQGGPDPEETFAAHPLGRDADPDDVTTVLVAVTGLFLGGARLPAPPGLPTLRAFQKAQGDQALAWLRKRL
ncbi:aminoglycoside phosphotransferase family protein [Streptomyces sp. A7024]|uniref:Aminoglycoside phosphotransferase family protein n=1 Tax=Streptomyces coryli TaxID=1128680 RepID=A0A6G4TZ38_9ACTN|nr:aminoglycoside phosphotransferase family protein [Streptomyces coryli]NGN64297.1 aminoglycoside phosphotransferase family protein [Streptomyces coryli]